MARRSTWRTHSFTYPSWIGRQPVKLAGHSWVVKRSYLAVALIAAGSLAAACSTSVGGQDNAATSPIPSTKDSIVSRTPGGTTPGAAHYQPGPQTISIDVAGVARTALLSVPADLSQPAPLIFAFHGHGGNARALDRQMGFETLWPQAIVVYPDGQTGHPNANDPTGAKTGWQQARGEGGDADVAFYDALLTELEADLPVDHDRIYLMGHSNGSAFVSLLRNERGQTVAATANSSAQPIRFIPTDPVLSMFMSMGRSDPTVPYDQQRQAVPVAAQHLDIDPSTTNVNGYLTTDTSPSGVELAVYDHPGGHEPPPELPALLVAFFQRHIRPRG